MASTYYGGYAAAYAIAHDACDGMQERLAAHQQEAQEVAAAKDALRAKLRAMEAKLVKGETQVGSTI